MKEVDTLEFTFEGLDNTDRIRVTTNLDRTITVVDDTETIDAVLSWVRSHVAGWTVPPAGVPIARLRLNFYQSGQFLGNVGVARSFLTAHQYGGFYSKASDEGEHAKLLDIIGLQEYGDEHTLARD